MLEHQSNYESSFLVRGDQPLIGVLTEEDGKEVVSYFLEEESAESAISNGVTQAALSGIGTYSDLDWEEMVQALDRIRHERAPTPPIEL